MKLTDWSNFQPVPSQADCDALLAAGFTGAIVGLQQPGHALKQLTALRANGVTVDDCYMESNPTPAIPDVSRVWVAVETRSGFTTEDEIDSAIAFIMEAGKLPGIYTSTFMIESLGLEAAFAGKYANIPRWYADYDGDETPPADYAMKQYSGGSLIPGIAYELDLDSRQDAPATIPSWVAELTANGGDVKSEPMDQGDVIATTNQAFERFGHVLAHDAGEDIVRVTDPPPPDGMDRILITFRKA